MLFPLMTVIAGSIVVLCAALSLARAVIEGGIFFNQLRFLVCGILLILHFPFTGLLAGLILPHLQSISPLAGNGAAAFWAGTFVMVVIQLIVLPTRRELYSTYMADRFSRG